MEQSDDLHLTDELINAAKHNHLTFIEERLVRLDDNARKRCLNTPESVTGYTILHYAAQQGHIQMVRRLLLFGAENTETTLKKYPFEVALNAGLEENQLMVLFNLLVPQENAAMLTHINYNGDTLAHVAVRCRCVEIFKKLHALAPAILTIVNQQGLTPCLLAVESEVVAIVEYCASRPEMQLRGRQQRHALHYAAMNRQTACLIPLLDYSPIDIVDAEHNTPLHVALREKRKAAVALFLQRGASINMESSDFNQAIHLAVKSLDTALVQLVLDRGAHINDANSQGITALQMLFTLPLSLLKKPEMTTMFQFLMEKNVDWHLDPSAWDTLRDKITSLSPYLSPAILDSNYQWSKTR